MRGHVCRALRSSLCSQEREKPDPALGSFRCGAITGFSLGAVCSSWDQEGANGTGVTATNLLDLYYMPYTHSLVGALIWSGAAFLIYKLVVGQKVSNTAALIVAFAVFSH